MDWISTIDSDHPLFVPFKGFGEPMGAEALIGCREWLAQFNNGAHADASLLTAGLRQGHLLEAGYIECRFGTGILFTVPNREARLVSPAQFCVIRLLALPGGDCEWWFDRSTKKDLPDEEQRWYLRYSHRTGIWGLRVLTNAQTDEVVIQRIKKQSENHLGHKDLRATNLILRQRIALVTEGKPMRRSYRGRKDAIDYAIHSFGPGFKHLDLSPHGYAALLAQSFSILDHLHREEIGSDAKAHRSIVPPLI